MMKSGPGILVTVIDAVLAPPPLFISLVVLYEWWRGLPWWGRWLYTIAAIGITVGVPLFLWGWFGKARALFYMQILLLTIAICSVPTAVYHLTRGWSIVARILVETTSFIVSLAGFGRWLFGLSVIHTWVIYAILLVLLLEIGGHGIDWYKKGYLCRVTHSSLGAALTVDMEDFTKMFRTESSLYLSVPLGFAFGMVASLVWDLPIQSTIVLYLLFALLLAPIVLLYFLIVAFIRMANAMFRVGNVPIAQVAQTTKHGLGRLSGQVLELVVPTQKPEEEDIKKRELDIACEVSNLRKLYLYDATHNILLLVTLTVFVLNFFGIIVGWALLVLSLVGATFLFSQPPYIIGQSLLHRQVLLRYTGVEHAEAAEKLGKYAPRFPTPTFIAALFTTGTAGGVLSGLLNEFVKALFK